MYKNLFIYSKFLYNGTFAIFVDYLLLILKVAYKNKWMKPILWYMLDLLSV